MAYTTIFEWVADATSANWRGYTTRMSVAAVELEAGTKFRLVAKGHPTQSTTISACVIAEGATAAGSEYGYLYPPIPVTWNGGSPGFTLAANAELASDPITLTYDPISGRPLVIGTWVEGTVPNNQDDMAANNAVFGSSLRYKTGNDLNNQSPTGYNVATADGWLYTKIEKEIVTAEKKRPVVNFSYFSLAPLIESFRYYRLLIEATNEGDLSLLPSAYAGLSYIGMVDGTMTDIINPSLYNTNGSGSTTESSPAYNVFRGPSDYSNGLVRKDGNNKWWYLWDFGDTNSVDIKEVLIRDRNVGQNLQQIRKFRLQGSSEGLSWSDKIIVDTVGDETVIGQRNQIKRFDGSPKPNDPGAMVSHRYWRIRAKTFIDSNWVTFRKVKFYTDVAFTSPIPVGGATYDYTTGPTEDGSASNAFAADARLSVLHQGQPSSVSVCYSTPQAVRGVSLASRAALGGQSIDTFAVDYSDDGQNWYESWSVSSQSPWGQDVERFFAKP